MHVTHVLTFKLHACDMQDLMNMHAVTSNMHVTGATFSIGDPPATVSEYEL